MRKISTTTKLAVAGVSAATLAASGVAYAYWSTTGTGSGTATTTAGAPNLLVTQTSAPSDLAPGVAAGGISVSVKNQAANSAYVAQVVVSIASVTGGAGACDATDYTLSSATMTSGAGDLASEATVGFSGATLGFNNKATNQDGCKGATVNLSYAVS